MEHKAFEGISGLKDRIPLSPCSYEQRAASGGDFRRGESLEGLHGAYKGMVRGDIPGVYPVAPNSLKQVLFMYFGLPCRYC